MGIEITIEGQVCHAQVQGDLTLDTAEAYRRAWLEHCSQTAVAGAGLCRLDLSGVTELDGFGLQLLVALEKQLTKSNGRVCLVNPSERVREVLAQVRLTEFFPETDEGTEQ